MRSLARSQQQAEILAHLFKKLAPVHDISDAMCLVNYVHNFSTNMVRTFVLGELRMRQQNTKATVPLDVAPERRTKRCSPRFRPGGRFCELRFRYLSSPTGREGEISRPLDHMRQIPFIHSARSIIGTNFVYIQQHSSYFLHVVRLSVSCSGAYLTFALALLQKHSYMVQSHYVLCFSIR